MKVCNIACDTCESYSPQNFKIEHYPCGKIQVPNYNQDCMIFLFSGRLSVKRDNDHDCICEANHTMLFVRNKHYDVTVLEPAYCLNSTFVTSYQVCDKMSMRDAKHLFDNIQYKFISIEIREPLKMMLDSIIYYMKDDINCGYWQRAKSLEFFVIFWNYYTLEEICRFFYPVVNKDIEFHSKVMANHTKAKTVIELAKLCGYSLPTFNKLFVEHFQGVSPYQWMLQQNTALIKARLFDKSVPIKAIVAEFGFIDQSYFNKYCKRFFGATALQVRKGND